MHDRVGRELGDRSGERAVEHVETAEPRGRMDVRHAARGQVVDDAGLVPARDERMDEVAADEAGPAGHEDAH